MLVEGIGTCQLHYKQQELCIGSSIYRPSPSRNLHIKSFQKQGKTCSSQGQHKSFSSNNIEVSHSFRTHLLQYNSEVPSLTFLAKNLLGNEKKPKLLFSFFCWKAPPDFCLKIEKEIKNLKSKKTSSNLKETMKLFIWWNPINISSRSNSSIAWNVDNLSICEDNVIVKPIAHWKVVKLGLKLKRSLSTNNIRRSKTKNQ